jgi:hypothetical protein
MATHKVITTDTKIDQAIECAKALSDEPRVLTVHYVPGAELDLFLLGLSDGRRIAIPREDLEGLELVTPAQIAQVEITGNGTGLHWPALDLDHYVPNLLRHIYGAKRWMAQIGQRGGSARSARKQTASQANGRKGGRPRLANANQ